MEESNIMRQNNVTASPTPTTSYIGVRKRKWGKFVSEIREPGKKTRIWLGSYEEAQMAAAAYDVAAFHLKGRAARLNFPELVEKLPMPASSKGEDIRVAAQQAALQFKKRPISEGGVNSNINGNGNGSANVPAVRVGLSPSQIQAINECPMDSPNMWMQRTEAAHMFGSLEVDESRNYDVFELSDWEEIQYESLWD
ncbi:unnamed protein product [Vicia faba]|uniref:AP2/ERF domain-containing protein n=1 Tax=Vicia faba TaxID=3906 RepID=A0AAV0YZC5_VICFA|nr:unnamed protein product [Vicia faba]